MGEASRAPRAAAFHASYGFEASGIDELTLKVPLSVVRATIADVRARSADGPC